MSELKAHNINYLSLHEIANCDFYLKSEADKVIAELKSELEAIELDFANLKEDALNTDRAREKWLQLARKQSREIRHHKYKRCLAMADFCESQYDYFNSVGNGFWLVRGDIEKRDKYRKKVSDFWLKWNERWLELAEKFKEAK